MATTVFNKPLDNEVASLNEQIDNLGDSVTLANGMATGNQSISNLNQYRYLNLFLQNATTLASIASVMCSVPIFKSFDSANTAFGIDTNHPGSTTRVYIYINYVNDTTINVQFDPNLGYKYSLVGIK